MEGDVQVMRRLDTTPQRSRISGARSVHRVDEGSRPQQRYVSQYTELSRTIRDSGLLDRRYGYYWSRIVVVTLAFAAVWAGIVMLGNSWFQLLMAGALGVVLTQFGFLGHDCSHRQIFRSPVWSEWVARVLSGAFAGLSHSWWKGKHDKHHANPNREGADPDIAPGVIAFTRDIADGREHGVRGWFINRQGWLFFPLLTLEGLNLHVASVRMLIASPRIAHRRIEATMVISRLVGYVVLVLLLMSPGKAAAFIGVQLAVFGVLLGGAFAPNHKGMPIVPATMRIDFLHRQVLMSRNVRGGAVTDFVMGGLNYQIEHHLFPSMPRPNLKHARPIVRDYCAQHQVPYTETGLFHSYAIVVSYLNNVGLQARDPFDCPLASQLRD
ncbi:MAG: acyl-CoA desaturase [Ornithinimicrobium sp.]